MYSKYLNDMQLMSDPGVSFDKPIFNAVAYDMAGNQLNCKSSNDKDDAIAQLLGWINGAYRDSSRIRILVGTSSEEVVRTKNYTIAPILK